MERTKKYVAEALKAGKSLDDIFDFTDGQECAIYKGRWSRDISKVAEVCYVKSLEFAEGLHAYGFHAYDEPIDDPEVIDEIVQNNMFTYYDFIVECGGNVDLAKLLFEFVDWQTPNVNDMLETWRDDEYEDICGYTKKQVCEILGSHAKVILDSNEIKLRSTEDDGIKIGGTYHMGDYEVVCISKEDGKCLMQTYRMPAGAWFGEGDNNDHDLTTKAFYKEWYDAVSDMRLLKNEEVRKYPMALYVVAPAFNLDESKIVVRNSEIKLK